MSGGAAERQLRTLEVTDTGDVALEARATYGQSSNSLGEPADGCLGPAGGQDSEGRDAEAGACSHLRLVLDSVSNTSASADDSYRLWNVDQAAFYLSVPKSTVYKLARTGEIPSCRVGDQTRFDPNILKEWILGRILSPLSTETQPPSAWEGNQSELPVGTNHDAASSASTSRRGRSLGLERPAGGGSSATGHAVFGAEPRWLRYAEAAVYTGFAEGTLRNMVSKRRIPFVKKGSAVRFDRIQLDRWMERDMIHTLDDFLEAS